MRQRDRLRTVWEVIGYGVSGNATEGWDVYDCWVLEPELILELVTDQRKSGYPWDPQPGTFWHAEITEQQIREALGCQDEQIYIDGDDTCVRITRRGDGYPIGALRCVSHESLNPILAY